MLFSDDIISNRSIMMDEAEENNSLFLNYRFV